MAGFEWLSHRNTRILYIELASQNKEELAEKIAAVSPVIEKEPPGSVRCIANTRNGRFNPEISRMLRDFTSHNMPHMKMTVLIGIEGLQKALYDTFILVMRRRNLVVKDTLQEALDFLADIK
jgi:hypothetical protein